MKYDEFASRIILGEQLWAAQGFTEDDAQLYMFNGYVDNEPTVIDVNSGLIFDLKSFDCEVEGLGETRQDALTDFIIKRGDAKR